jgi:carboxymethylenebutenolidase
MCFDLDSLPPIPVLAGAAVSHRLLELTAADGNRFSAFAATPDGGATHAGVVILPDVRGLYRFYEELALRFAERGLAAIAFDYFGRTAGVGERGEDFDYTPHVQQARTATVQQDVRAAIDWLRSDEGGARHAIVTVGFCFGGAYSWLAAADQDGLAGAIGFYGRPGERNGEPGPLLRAAELRAPILGLMGGADAAIPQEDVAEFELALEAAGKDFEIVTYPGAPHSFFDRKQEEFADASADAWARVLRFVEERTAVQL